MTNSRFIKEIKDDKHGLERPFCLWSSSLLVRVSLRNMPLNLASDLSSRGNPGKKRDLGIERAKERDKVERYLKKQVQQTKR